jgi:transglutaminase-like putative cysteine protease
MRLRLRHLTRYQYSEAVFFEPHVLRLRPRATPWHLVDHHEMRVSPLPAGQSECLDSCGNFVTSMWFTQPASVLETEVITDLRLLPYNPYAFVLHPPELARLPLVYSPDLDRALKPFLAQDGVESIIRDLARATMGEANGDTVSFLALLNNRLFAECEQVIRDEGAAHGPALTWQQRRGACRDLAVLFIAVCRSTGMAARFVSGYSLDERHDDERHLHAWVEVYLPGAGWRGFDPSQGVAVTERHIALAAAPSPVLAAPVSGTFRGEGHCTAFDARIEVEVHDGLQFQSMQ